MLGQAAEQILSQQQLLKPGKLLTHPEDLSLYKKTLTKTSTTSLATRGPSSWDTGQANHYCLEGLQGKAQEGLALLDGLHHLGGEEQDHQGHCGLGGAVASQEMPDDQFKCELHTIICFVG